MNHHYQMSVSQASGSGDLCGSPVNVTAPVTSSATTDVTAGGNDQQIQLLIGLNGYHHQSYHQGEMAADGTMMSMDDGSGYHLNQMPTDDTNQPYAIYQVQYQDLPQGQPMSTGAYDDWNKNLDYGESQAAQMVVQQSPQPVQTTDQSQMWVPAGQVDNYHQMVSAATHQQQQMNMNMMPTVSTVSSGTITIPPVQPSQHQMYTTIAYQNQGGQIVINNHQPATETPQQQVIQQQQIQPQQIIQQQQQPLTKQTQVQQQQAKPSPLPKAKKSQPKQPPKPKAVKATKSKPENEEGGGAVVEKVTKGKKKTKKKDETGEGKAESKPKTKEKTKPVSAYALFFRDTQAAIKTEHPKAAFGEISKIVASKWEVLEKDQKDIYKERADQEKKIYLHNLASSKAKEVAEQNAMQQQNQAAQAEVAVQPAQPQLSPVPQQVQSAQLDQLHHQQQQQQQQQQQLPPSDPSASNQYMTHHAHPNPAYQSTSQAQQQSELSLMLMGQTNNGLSLNETSSESGFGSLSHLNYGDAGGYQPAGQPPQPGLDVMDGQSSSDATFNPYDSSFFDSQLATSNLMDFDLNEFDDINLLPTGGPFSPSTTGVFDPTIVANDYLSDFENNTSDSFGLGIATDEVSICQAAEDLMNLGPPPPYPTIEPNKPTDQRMMVKMEPSEELGSNVDMNHANGIVTPSCEVTNHVTDTIKVEEEEAKPMVCMRKGCGRLGVHSPQWDGEFCSEQCCVLFSKDAFQSWIAEHRVRTSTQPEMDSKTALNSLVTCLTTPSL